MITNKPSINYTVKYAKLFEEALDVLHKNNKALDVTQITSLEQYFMHIGDLAALHKANVSSNYSSNSVKNTWNARFATYSKFLMLPLDEEPFKINANTRVISVPANFASHGVSLHGDYHAETLMFEVDRYFDTIDLIRTNIFVQWKSPSGLMGSTEITLVDYDSEKIRFGWTLSSNVIDADGALTFSVRFIERNDTDTIIYSLNTLAATVKVKPALSPSIAVEPTDEYSWLFADAVVNGANSGVNQYPEMAVIYKDLADIDATLTSNSCTFEVGAYPIDLGELSYQWVYNPYDGSDPLELNSEVTHYIVTSDDAPKSGRIYYTKADDVYSAFEGETFESGTDYYEKNMITQVEMVESTDSTVIAGKRYYETDDEGAYILIEDLTAFEDGKTYYEPHAKLTVCDSSNNKIAGTYHVLVVNTVSGETTSVSSTKSTIPATTSIDFATDLKADGASNILVNTAAEGEEPSYSLDLTVVPKTDHSSVTTTYQWSVASAEDGTFSNIPSATNATYTATEPGWYKVTATGTLNRTSTFKDSIPAKVTNSATAPTISSDTGNTVTYSLTGLQEQDITVTASVDCGELNEALMSDGLTYLWQRQIPEMSPAQYEAAEVGKNGVVAIDANKITVKYANDTEIFRCLVTNHLNGSTAEKASDKYSIIAG